METYDEIFDRMRERYIQLSGCEPAEESDITIRLRVLAGEIYSALVNLEWLKGQMFASTASGEYLDRHAETRGIHRRQKSYASGTVIFYISQQSTQDIVIPKGTIVSTSGVSPVYFETVSEVCLYKGGYSAHAQVVAMESGIGSNVMLNSIDTIVTPVAGITSVRNPDPLTGGVDSESDGQLRARVADSYKNASNGTNCAYYKMVALETEGVSGANVVPRARGAGTVNVYVSGYGQEVYDGVLEELSRRMSSLREVNVDVQVLAATPVTVPFSFRMDVKDGYDFDKVKQDCVSALGDYVSSCGVGTKLTLVEAGERLYHVEGIREYSFISGISSDLVLDCDEFAVLGDVSITQGVV